MEACRNPYPDPVGEEVLAGFAGSFRLRNNYAVTGRRARLFGTSKKRAVLLYRTFFVLKQFFEFFESIEFIVLIVGVGNLDDLDNLER